MEKYLDIVE
jgi:ABC-type transport system involved in multi-copper enzyme maturation permease subunit